MALGYSDTYDLTTDIGKLRLVIGDGDLVGECTGAKPDGSSYSDEELAIFIEIAGSWKRGVSLTLRSLAALYARYAINQEIDGHSKDMTKIATQLQEASTKWDEQLDKLNQAIAADSAVSWSDCFGFKEAPHIFGMEQYGARIQDAAT